MNNRGSATAIIGGVVGVIMLLYISVVLLSNMETSISKRVCTWDITNTTQTCTGLTSTMNSSYTNLQTNSGTAMNLGSMYPMVIIAGAMIAAFLGFAYGG